MRVARAQLVLWAALAAGVCGCGRRADVTLYQPFARGTQQHIRLTSERAYHAVDGAQQATVLEFALPHSVSGPRAYVLYLTGPDGTGTVRVDPESATGLCGFFVQEVGHLAGRTDLVAGTIQYRHFLLLPQWHQVELDLRCDDGTEIRGRAVLEEAPSEIHTIEREYAADIAQLRSCAEVKDETAPAAHEESPGEPQDREP